MELHYTNRILPPSVVSNVRSDDEANWRDIEATMVGKKWLYPFLSFEQPPFTSFLCFHSHTT